MVNEKTMALVLAALLIATSAMAAEGWLNDYEKALKQAEKTDKPILADFSGTDWCGPCQALDKRVFAKDDFKKWAEKNVVLLKLEYLRHSKLPKTIEQQNERLARTYGIMAFPTILLLDHRGETFASLGYAGGGPDQFIKRVEAQLKDRPEPVAPDPDAEKIAYDGGWIDGDYKKALTVAAQQDRYPLVLITGTGWAEAAKQLEKKVLDTKAFKAFADKHLVLMRVDVPNPNEPSKALEEAIGFARRLAVNAVPTAVLKTPANRRLATLHFNPDQPEAFLEAVKTAVESHKAKSDD